jgi:hypothetical protein
MYEKQSALIVAVAAVALTLVACGENPASPSEMSKGVVVRGVLLSEDAVGASSVRASGASGSSITVTVEGNPSLSTTIAGNGTFELEVPAGTFTLVFTKDGAVIGTITITAEAGMEVKIVVKKEDTVIVLVDLQLDDNDDTDDDANATCLIEGGRVGDRIELEGKVTSGGSTSFRMTTNGNRARGPVDVVANGASFRCNGNKSAECQNSVSIGDQVHVRGTLMTCTATSAQISATEVKLQSSADDD